MDSVSRHFSRAATNYKKKSENLIWRQVRAAESKVVLGQLGDLKKKTCLDIGCGAGFYSKLMIQKGAKAVTAIDQCQEMLHQFNHPKITKILGHAENIKTENKFNIILMAGVLEFVDNPLKALVNVKKLCHHNSKLVLLVPEKKLLTIFYSIYHNSHGIKISMFSEKNINKLFFDSNWSLQHIHKCFPFSLVAVAKHNGK